MRVPSRRMPKDVVEPISWRDVAVLAGITLFLMYVGFHFWPWSLSFPFIVVVMTLSQRRRDRHIAEARRGESICTFARSFECRTVDTWIIRSTYDELSYAFPVRACDRFQQDLRFADEDLDDSGNRIARRCGRSMVRCEENPLYGKVHTVRDLVMFLNHQPLVAPAGN